MLYFSLEGTARKIHSRSIMKGNNESILDVLTSANEGKRDFRDIYKKDYNYIASDTKETSLKHEASNNSFTEKGTNDEIPSAEVVNSSGKRADTDCYKNLQKNSDNIPSYDTSVSKIRMPMMKITLVRVNNTKQIYPGEGAAKYVDEASYVCACVTTSCILLYAIMFISVKKLRNLAGYCLLSLSFSVFATYVCFFTQRITKIAGGACTTLGVFVVYFFLASFFWMNTISYDVWKSIRMAAVNLKRTRDSSSVHRFALYSIYAWGSSLIIVSGAIIFYVVDPKRAPIIRIEVNDCWFEYKQVYLCYFGAFIIILFIADIIFFITSIYMVSKASLNEEYTSKSGSKLRSRLCFAVRLGSIMGFIWIFGILATLTPHKWLWYLCSIFTSLQGFCICFNLEIMKKAIKNCKAAVFSRKSYLMSSRSSQESIFHVSLDAAY